MTTIHVDLREILATPITPEGELAFSPDEDVDGGYLLTRNELIITTVDGEATFDLPAGVINVRENGFSGARRTRLIIPASGTVEYGDLEEAP